MIKKRILIIIVSSLFISCKQDIKSKPLKTIPQDSIVTINVASQTSRVKINKCGSKEINKSFYNPLVKDLKIKEDEFYDITSLQRFSNEEIDDFFNTEEIKCFLSISGKSFRIVELQYVENHAESVMNRIKTIHQDKNSFKNNSYHDFFKRGIVIGLNTKEDKLTLLFFNPFINPKLVEKVERYFYKKDIVEEIFLSTGLGTIKSLTE